jgi:sulfite reductase (NADPH) flavoprotein alpha-component
MTQVQLVPPSAPFDEQQRAWLNGFFAGLMNMQDTGDGTSPINASATMSQLGEGSDGAAEAEETFPWHDDAMPIDERMKLAEGKPLNRRLMASMAQLDCGACGYLCQTYAEAIANGEETNLKLCDPGGRETAKTIKLILADESAALPTEASTATDVEAVSSTNAYTRKNPLAAAVLESTALNAEGADKDTRHIVIDLGDSGLTYEVGDSLGVYPSNCPELADAVICALNTDPVQKVTAPTGSDTSLYEALIHHADLKDFDESLVSVFINATNNGDLGALRELARDDDAMAGMDVLDLIEMFPRIKVSAQDLMAVLEPLKPRLYSIASSLKKHPGQVHLTVGKATTMINGRLRKGVASTMFAERVLPGDTVRVFVQSSHGFAIPDNDDTPIIMVGPGTGIAPFRAFLQEREARKADGGNWLFFGDRQEEYDFLYREELLESECAGQLTRLDTAFSRDQEDKVYVQDRMLERGAELWAWLNRGAHFYVCGDANRMARDVDRALHHIVREHSNVSEDEAKAYMVQLSSQGRYQRDVY